MYRESKKSFKKIPLPSDDYFDDILKDENSKPKQEKSTKIKKD